MLTYVDDVFLHARWLLQDFLQLYQSILLVTDACWMWMHMRCVIEGMSDGLLKALPELQIKAMMKDL